MTGDKNNDIIYFSNKMGSNSFRFSKTMPKNPHWYTLRREWDSDAEFVRCVKIIREHGDIEHFWRKPYVKLKIGGFKYWTMGAPIGETILINRAKA